MWQTFVGSSSVHGSTPVESPTCQGLLERTNLAPTLPPTLRECCHLPQQAVGGAHGVASRKCVVVQPWVLCDAGVAPPGWATPRDAFTNDLAKVAAGGLTPLCLGGKDRFTATELFENTLLGVIGPDGWTRIADDSFDWRGSQLREALTRFGQIVSRLDPNAGGLTWDEAAKKLATGECAFLSMNDSVYGELEANRVAEGKDFGYLPYPGTTGAYLAIVDTFVVSADAQDGVNAIKFLETLAQSKTTLEFNKVKVRYRVRNDVDMASLPAYQRQAFNCCGTTRFCCR